MTFSLEDLDAVQRTISSRRTFKVLRDPEHPVSFEQDFAQQCQSLVQSAIVSADWAPFHYDRAADSVPQPWRVDILWHDACQKIAGNFYQWFDDVKPGNKIPAMLSACGACVIVSWLPQFEATETEKSDKQRAIDEEHLAAASAYVQNLLLLLTAANMGTYWSSGGQFRESAMKAKVGISEGKVLAAVFVDFMGGEGTGEPNDTNAAQRLPGKLADKRAPLDKWCREISVSEF